MLLLLDVDRFKAINDTLGHAVGDAVIARLGDALRSRLRSADVVARLGGDEFAAILRRVDLPAAREVARDLQAVVAQRLASVVGDAHASGDAERRARADRRGHERRRAAVARRSRAVRGEGGGARYRVVAGDDAGSGALLARAAPVRPRPS